MTAIIDGSGRFLGGTEPSGHRWHCNLCGWGKPVSKSKPYPTEEKAKAAFTKHLKLVHGTELASPLPQLGRMVGREQVIR